MPKQEYIIRTCTTPAGLYLHAGDLINMFVDFSCGPELTTEQALTVSRAAQIIEDIANEVARGGN